MEQPVISFKSFTFQYFSQAEPTLYDINLDIMPGEKILIVGPSGCGKSTLGHCLNGLIPFAYKGKISGSLTIKGKETKNQNNINNMNHTMQKNTVLNIFIFATLPVSESCPY